MGMFDQIGMQMGQPSPSAFMAAPTMNPQSLMLLQQMQNQGGAGGAPGAPAGMPGAVPGAQGGIAPNLLQLIMQNPQLRQRLMMMMATQGSGGGIGAPMMGGPSAPMGAPPVMGR